MYPTTNSSSPSSHDGDRSGNGSGSGLSRYGSAPGSLLTTAADSVINGQNHHHHHIDFSALGRNASHMTGTGSGSTTTRFFPSPSPSSSTTTTREQLHRTSALRLNEFATAFNGLKRANECSSSASCSANPTTTASPSLLRHSSSPAGFLNGLIVSSSNDGRVSGLSSQLSFTGRDSLSQFSGETSIIFSPSSSHNKQAKLLNSDVSGLHILDSELQFGLSETALEAAAMEKLMDIPHDSVPCKIRAKRGCATHPRSIAERERRTRISGKLKKLQDLVPNMDKQTSYADMLDLAVQHIKGLQADIQNLNNELQNCTCGCKPTS